MSERRRYLFQLYKERGSEGIYTEEETEALFAEYIRQNGQPVSVYIGEKEGRVSLYYANALFFDRRSGVLGDSVIVPGSRIFTSEEEVREYLKSLGGDFAFGANANVLDRKQKK